MFHFRQTEPLAEYGTPQLWNVCFAGLERNRWFDRFLRPGFRHVFMVGYVAEFGLWLKYEVLFSYSSIAIVSGDYAAGLICKAMHDGDVLTMRPMFHMKHRVVSRLGLWCVPAVRHALGVRCVALTPQGIHRFLLKNGAKSLKAVAHELVQHAEGSA